MKAPKPHRSPAAKPSRELAVAHPAPLDAPHRRLLAEALRRESLQDWCVREDWFATAAAACRFMHCLPVRRNVAVADEVLDGPRSIVQREAHNRLPAQMAVLHRLLSA